MVLNGLFLIMTVMRYWKHAFYLKHWEYQRRIKKAEAAAKLIKMSDANVAAFIFVINLFDLDGCKKLEDKGFKVENLIEFPGH